MHFSTLLIKGLFFWYFQQIHGSIDYLPLIDLFSVIVIAFLIVKYVY